MNIFFNDTATTEIYTLALHDALPIFLESHELHALDDPARVDVEARDDPHALHAVNASSIVNRPSYSALPTITPSTPVLDRKSTRLNSSHANISYAVFCLKKKTTHTHI